jgi:hypothetical protein
LTGKPSIDPELMIRMLIIDYCFGSAQSGGLVGVRLNLAYRWFCWLGLDGQVPDHSTFSKNRHGRFRQSDLLRRVFTVLGCRIWEGLVGAKALRLGAGWESDRLGLHGSIERHAGQVIRPQRAALMRYPQALGKQQLKLIAEPFPPMAYTSHT